LAGLEVAGSVVGDMLWTSAGENREMTRIGIVGLGFMGYTHFEGARDLHGAQVTAFATRNEKKLAGDWTGIQGNFGPPGGQIDVSELKCYSDYKQLLADPDIDLVDICLPTDKHFDIVMESLAAGKATLVEKPISVDLPQAEQMVTAAEKAGVPLMVAHVLPFFPEFRFVADTIASKTYGDLKAGHFKRVICRPEWSNDMSDFRKLGGWGIDLHIHDNHFILHTCGRPDKVFSTGLLENGLVNHVHTNYVYGDGGPAITAVSGGIAAKGLAFGHGFELYFEEATILFDAGTYGGEWVVSRPLSVVTNDGRIEAVDLSGNDKWCAAFTQELQTAVDHLNGKSGPGPLSDRLALDALSLCYAEARSIASGKPETL
jgi:predicted dehydrogenase